MIEPFYRDADVQLYHGKSEHVLPTLPADSVDAVVTDPPYELGFMGRTWDASGIAYSVELWREVLRVVKPGGHLLAFGGTRTVHRMTCAIEDAGFEILMRWLIRLVTPPGGTVLEPFAGSGTTIEACLVEGFRCIAVEREAKYLPLIMARISKPIESVLPFDAPEVSDARPA